MASRKPIVVQLYTGSDGDATHTPPPGVHSLVDPPTLYLEKLATAWMEARGEAKPRTKYILASLPAGYSVWQRPRPAQPRITDKYLFGHPSHKPFDSPNRFYPHFEYLMTNGGTNIGCPCTVCAGSAGVLPAKSAGTASTNSSKPRRPASSVRFTGTNDQNSATSPHFPRTTASQPIMIATTKVKGRPNLASEGLDTSHVDEEGTPDVYRNLIDELKRVQVIDKAIEETLSPDWRAEQQSLSKLLVSMEIKEQWIPRSGELVLFMRELPDSFHFVRLERSNELRLFDSGTGQLRTPAWEAGVVTQVPTTEANTASLLNEGRAGPRAVHVIYSGVRVEPMSDPNSLDKSLSKRYKYVTLQQIRPFVLWQEILRDVPVQDRHPTVDHALKVTTTMSLMGKHRFKGAWPEASIFSHGMHLGPELLIVGDTVRLLPSRRSGQIVCSDIMVIRSIRLKLLDLDRATSNDYDRQPPYRLDIWVYGCAYTGDPARSDKQWLSDENNQVPKAAAEYGPWYPLHPPDKELAVPYSRLLGRLYERDALSFFLNCTAGGPSPDLDSGRVGLIEARAYARKNDDRIIPEANPSWFWCESRAEALDLHTLNGIDTANHDLERDMKEARKRIKVLDGTSNTTATAPGSSFPSSPDHGLRRFMAPSLPLRTQASDGTSAAISETETGSSSTEERGYKRHLGNDFTSSEADSVRDEYQQETRIIKEEPGLMKKKTRVMVVVND